MKLDLLLIRHGQTDWNVAKRWQGITDIPLNATGLAQANALANRLQKRYWAIDTIYTSNLLRARVTAETVAHALNLPIQLEPLWRERDAGEFSGLTRDEITTRIGGSLTALEDPPSGENLVQVRDRAVAGYNQILDTHQSGTVAVFSHGNILALLIAHLLGMPLKENRRFSMGNNCGMSHIKIDEGRPRIHLLNCAAHLE